MSTPGTTGLILEEELLFEQSVPGRIGYSLPESDLTDPKDLSQLPTALLRKKQPHLPEISEAAAIS